MGTGIAKKIKKYVRLKIKEENYDPSQEERIYKVMKKTYETASVTKQAEYRNDMDYFIKSVTV